MGRYGVDISGQNIQAPLVALKIIYEEMPETTGCEQCPLKNADNVHWCCREQSPSMYYVEFLYVWEQVQMWSKRRKMDVILSAIRNYLRNRSEKGCIFFRDDKCTIYERRPFACRLYGITSPESWQKRWDSLKEQQKEDFKAKPQCNLVSCVGLDTSYLSEEKENHYFGFVRALERRIGINAKIVALHDHPLGTYRTFHDHILLEMFGEDFMTMLTAARLKNPSEEDIDKLLVIVKGTLDQILDAAKQSVRIIQP